MIPIRDNMVARQSATVTWTLIGLNVLIYLWDRGGALAGPNMAFADLAMRPAEVVRAVSGTGDPTELGKLFTSMFLHGGLLHLIGNVIFLLAFGPNVEVALGSVRYVLYYLFWGLVASLAHILVDPGSTIPTLGASGAIGGVLGCYFLLFPANRITVIVPPFFFFPFAVPAWVLLGLWFVWQILFPQAGVANWAHAGGFLAGMVTVLIMGGRQSVLKDREQDWEYDEDDEYEFA